MTNGEKLIEIFPNNEHISLKRTTQFAINPMTINQQTIVVDNDFWNAEYKEPTTKNDLAVDCISREQAKIAIRDKFKDLPLRVEINTILNELPSVTPQPRKGHWILTDVESYRVWHCHCSECGKDPQDYIGGSEDWWLIKGNLPKFCPNCGIKMAEQEK